MTRLLVCGSREWTDRARIRAELLVIAPFDALTHGAYRGADAMSVSALLEGGCCNNSSVSVEPYAVDHTLDGPWPGAGPRRNARMLRDGKPDRGLAFGALWKRETAARNWGNWKPSGTGGMVALMLAANLPVRWIAAPGTTAIDLTQMPEAGR